MTAPPFKWAERIRGLDNMNVNQIALGDRVSSSCKYRRQPAKDEPIDDWFCVEDGPTASGRSALKSPGALNCHCTRTGHG
jgi:hypothetical protein